VNAPIAALALLLTAGAAPQVLTLDPAASTVRYHVNHKLHQVDGVSRSAEGKAILEADGQVRAMVRIPVQSFDSGDSNRDAHMLETLQAGSWTSTA
jgi:polyisoprenoid-binding protein YceI